MLVDLGRLEIELKKRLNFPYSWGRKQNDDWDSRTRFIYTCRSFSQLINHTVNFDNALKNYAFNRWLNYWSAQGVEQIFCNNPRVVRNKNPYDKLVDFYIDNIPFDHKTSVFPKGFGYNLEFALSNERILIEWLYASQSGQGRQHHHNRLFVLLYDTVNAHHWQLKAEIGLIKSEIEKYLRHFDKDNLKFFRFDNRDVYSDIIWVIR